MKTADHVYFVAECGQNHNGELSLAKQLIDLVSQPVYFNGHQLPGVDAVKFQKRELSEELSTTENMRPYGGPNSYGATYGEHRRALELSYDDHARLYDYAKAKGLDFIDTVCSPGALAGILENFQPDALKVASRDLRNEPLLLAIARAHLPVILSTGMGTWEDAQGAVDTIVEEQRKSGGPTTDVHVLHCVSAYPASYDDLNLSAIGQSPIVSGKVGFSDHTPGILSPSLAVMAGARIIEKHVTLDRSMVGSDHAGSLAPEGVMRCVRDVRNAERAVGNGTKKVPAAVAPFMAKLERSVAARRDIAAEEIITDGDIHLVSPGTGLRWDQRGAIVGKRAVRHIATNELVVAADVG
jgi:sialic acid synthase SpsE